jgi:hypothetical protein
MARQRNRAQACSSREARSRRSHARKFLEVAEIASSEHDQDPEYASAAASLAVLAGIAASDAACCKALGERSRAAEHHAAESLLRQITPGGATAAKNLQKLIDLKDAAHYGFLDITRPELRKALRQARSLLDFADDVLSRG